MSILAIFGPIFEISLFSNKMSIANRKCGVLYYFGKEKKYSSYHIASVNALANWANSLQASTTSITRQ